MNHALLKRYDTPFILLLLILFALYSFFIRITPLFSGNHDILSYVGSDDPIYNLRMVEQMLAHYPDYSWFDPMTYYPYGQPMHWGPLFTWISATCCLIAGAVTRTDIIAVCLLVPPAMAAVLVPLVYLLVRKVSDRKSGLIAAGIISFIPGQYFARSFYGYFDHHIGEVLFSTLFCLCYGAALVWCRAHPATPSGRDTWKMPLALGALAGIAYSLGLSLMPTMILFALIVGIFTPLWFVLDRLSGRSGFSILLVNLSTFFLAIIGFFLIGIHAESAGLNYYTIGHPIAYSLLIGGTCILYALSFLLRKKSCIIYFFSIIGLLIVFLLVFALFLPDQYAYYTSNIVQFFGQDIHWKTIREAKQWTFEDAWAAFNYCFFLAFGGVLVLLYRIVKKFSPADLFLLIWSGAIFYATTQHVRYEYFLAVPLAILSGICLGFLVCSITRDPKKVSSVSDVHEKRRKKSQAGRKSYGTRGSGFRRPVLLLLLVVSLVFTVLFTYQSILVDISMTYHMDDDWREATTWLGEHTPDPGVDYLKIYSPQTWSPPPESYGVMSWWDYGHMITYLGKRIPNANPFQYGVDGDLGSARFFLTTSEETASAILDKLNTRYVMTDYLMEYSIFGSMALWNDTEKGSDPFMDSYIMVNPDKPDNGSIYPVLNENYYNTMVARFHTFDGSMVIPENVTYVQYVKPEYSHLQYPVVAQVGQIPYDQAEDTIRSMQARSNPQYGYALVGTQYTVPSTEIPALRHFRLIHESPNRVTTPDAADIRAVKIFEYVPGAEIKGDGILSLPVKTGTGRQFLYRQKSINGSFLVPYPTDTTIGDVRVGRYTNEGTGRVFEVTEEDVQNRAVLDGRG